MGEVQSPVNDTDQQEPLLFSNYDSSDELKKNNIFTTSVKWVLKISIWVVSVSWIILLFLYPMEWFHLKFEDWMKAAAGTVYEISGRVLLVYSLPVVIVAILGTVYKAILDSEEQEQDEIQLQGKSSYYRLWTFPVMVDGVFGVVSAAELIGLVIMIVFLMSSTVLFTLRNMHVGLPSLSAGAHVVGISLAEMGSATTALLFLPIARGSALLRLIDVPFAHAAKYHIWIGNLTMLFFTLHAIAMVVAYTLSQDFISVFSWDSYDFCNLAGVIALIIGLFMWITSISAIRRKYFETFIYSHQLYVLFLIFFAMHVGDFYFSFVAGGLFIFMLDRFLRFWQSQGVVDVISAEYHSCGVLELAISKPRNMRYNAMSFIFLRIREVSWLQWHPFSISSSPLDGQNRISIMIKVQGKWTRKLKDQISTILSSDDEQNLKLSAFVEGPYGYELPYHIMYTNLILVAGGIGISPFLAILSDILHRIRDGKPCLVTNILLIWSIKKSNELSIPSKFDMNSICPFYSRKLRIETRIYVTRESDPPLEEGNNSVHSIYGEPNGRSICSLVGTRNNKWLAIYFIASTIGFVIGKVLLYVFYINSLEVPPSWYKGFLLLASMVFGVVLFGGLVLYLWHLHERKYKILQCENDGSTISEQKTVLGNDNDGLFGENTKIQYGSRPDFQDTFEALKKEWRCEKAGVIVCGPSNMEANVARECRTFNLRRKRDELIFHFHGLSFSL